MEKLFINPKTAIIGVTSVLAAAIGLSFTKYFEYIVFLALTLVLIAIALCFYHYFKIQIKDGWKNNGASGAAGNYN